MGLEPVKLDIEGAGCVQHLDAFLLKEGGSERGGSGDRKIDSMAEFGIFLEVWIEKWQIQGFGCEKEIGKVGQISNSNEKF